MKKIIKYILALSILSSGFLLADVTFAKERNVKSSCSLFGSGGAGYDYGEKGRCVIKTYISEGYIMIEVRTPWDNVTGDFDLIRLKNNRLCTIWKESSNKCRGEFWYGDRWSYIIAEESSGTGKTTFSYSIGNAYMVTYDGALPIP